MRTEISGIGLSEGFKIFPEGFGVFFILRQVIGASKSKCPAEAGGLPNIFYVKGAALSVSKGQRSKVNFASFVICPVAERFGVSEVKRNEFTENADLPIHDFVGFFEEHRFAFVAESLGKLFTGGKGEKEIGNWLIGNC